MGENAIRLPIHRAQTPRGPHGAQTPRGFAGRAAREPVDPSLDLESEIARLKKEKNAVLLAHYYQDSDIQDVADFVGDSLQLAQAAAKTNADVICFAGVHFMAETAKILNPERTVVVPDLDAGCSLADGCPADKFAAWKARHPGSVVVSYINCSAEVKALSDYIVTSSNAEKIVASIPRETKILFAPDRNLGAYLSKKLARPMELWPGSCIVHEMFSHRKLVALKERYPDAMIAAHPECEEVILKMADYIGSTTGILKYVVGSPKKQFIVVTEPGILHQIQKQAPDKELIPAPPEASCACNECPHMKKNTLEKVYLALRDLAPTLEMKPDLMAQARRPIDKMLALS
jgi:quinolinate synthase